MVDTLVGVGIMGVFVVTVLGAVSAGVMGLNVAQDAAVAESVTRSQLESVKSQVYVVGGGYPAVVVPSGYSVAVGTAAVSGTDPNTIQQVSVTIYRGAKVVRVTNDFKVNR
ncbi:MAG: hypothetical protein HY671_04820 [Chloroflexi bacterium]|nr:hypothetical protein [Chloroflexota bacterium]